MTIPDTPLKPGTPIEVRLLKRANPAVSYGAGRTQPNPGGPLSDLERPRRSVAERARFAQREAGQRSKTSRAISVTERPSVSISWRSGRPSARRRAT